MTYSTFEICEFLDHKPSKVRWSPSPHNVDTLTFATCTSDSAAPSLTLWSVTSTARQPDLLDPMISLAPVLDAQQWLTGATNSHAADMAWAGESSIVLAGRDGVISVVELPVQGEIGDRALETVVQFAPHRGGKTVGEVGCCALAVQGTRENAKLATAGTDGSLSFCSVDGIAVDLMKDADPLSITGLAWRTSSEVPTVLATGNQDGEIRVWDVRFAAKPQSTLFSAHSSDIWEVAFSPNSNEIVSCSEDGSVCMVSWQNISPTVGPDLYGRTDAPVRRFELVLPANGTVASNIRH
ncbi:WD40-repeat-containing domain protein [Blyttiomyces helicus]|uniref:WD40-repeat-containing domain protein n=1 Tax=Blyttiomyces helicus TaxID=388810 RepID=A0A4P9W7H3_9FUNG|nr:WD40-repeat-containing domain protein [Blyttiomyces helicus]|eukprot:RKO86978.1 WD40-repeat-containing domain protein [Blyttiomyces helicus]